MSARKWKRDLCSAVEQHCQTYDIERRGSNHYGVTLHHNGKKRMIFTSSTPGDVRVLKNFERKVRRTVAVLADELDESAIA